MTKVDIPLLSSIYLVQEYPEDLSWFIPELIDEREKVKVINELDQSILLGIVQGLGTKKGNIAFKKFRQEKMNRLEELNLMNKNIFERLARVKETKTNTVFDKLKFFKEQK